MKSFWEKTLPNVVVKCGTPCFVYSWEHVQAARRELGVLSGKLPIRHWLSVKTSPVRPLLASWRDLGEGAEVVSHFELLAALSEGFSPDNILVNGVGKHVWLPDIDVCGLRVQFDSLKECVMLAPLARQRRWRVGLRFQAIGERDPDDARYRGQFGLTPDEAPAALDHLKVEQIQVESVHFHLRSNVRAAKDYQVALQSLATSCIRYGLFPRVVDCGGGLPVPGERIRTTGESSFSIDLLDLASVLAEIPSLFPSAVEIWLENGRFILARAGVLVVRVIDVKDRPDGRYLICDGGRTNHALVSDWQHHDLFTIPDRGMEKCHTIICGPTCMAFDWLTREALPSAIEVGDLVVWMNAGAYHIPWETRFSHGLAPVAWLESSGEVRIVRRRESFKEWWGQWDECN